MMRLGAQLFTLRDYTQTAQDLDRSLEQVARMGYQTVQVSAIGPIPAQQVREICDKHGLRVVLTHWNPDRILNDTEAVIEEHEILGCDYIGLGMMPKKYCTAGVALSLCGGLQRACQEDRRGGQAPDVPQPQHRVPALSTASW